MDAAVEFCIGHNLVADILKPFQAEGKAEAILQILSEFGNVPPEMRMRIASEKDMGVLGRWLRVAVRSESVQQFMEKIDPKPRAWRVFDDSIKDGNSSDMT